MTGPDAYTVIPTPAQRARCKTCLDGGVIEVTDCTCWVGNDWGHEGHDDDCGFIPCPEGCGDDA